jgi:electron transfer flavoprotein alpha subunit
MMKKNKNILVFAEMEEGKIHPIAYELLGKGQNLASKSKTIISAVLLGHQVRKEANELVYYGADRVFLFDHHSLEKFDIIRYKENIIDLIKEEKPEIILIGATNIGRTLGPRIAAALKTGLTADCIELDIDKKENLIQIRPAFSGNILAKIMTRTRPQMATVRYKVMKKIKRNQERKGEIIIKKVKVIKNTGLRILGIKYSNEIDLAEAKLIVSGGRGLKKPKDIKLLEDFATLLGGVVGSSRPLVDKNWIKKEHQVGFSGNTVKPRVYIACGISGAPQHLFGMRDSEIIIAINKDPTAQIFTVADYIIEGDLYQILSALIKKISKHKKEKHHIDK